MLLVDLVKPIELPDDVIRFRRQMPPATDNTMTMLPAS
jgi:hypothetical protein